MRKLAHQIGTIALISMLSMLVSKSVFATNYETKKDGKWSKSKSWVNYPGTTLKSNDSIFIKHNITMDKDIKVENAVLVVEASGYLHGSKNLELKKSTSVLLTYGDISIKKIKVDKGSVTASGDITLSDKLEIKGGATFSTTGQTFISKDLKVEGGSTVTFSDSISVGDDLDFKGSSVTFSAGLYVKDQADISSSTVNFHGNTYIKDKIDDISSNSVVNIYDNFYVNGNLKNNSATINNYGILTVKKDLKSSGSSAAINNNGTLNVLDDLTISAGTYDNNGTINVTDQSSINGTFTNDGTFNGTGTITISWSGNFTNNGNLSASGDLNNYKTLVNNGTLTVGDDFYNGWSATTTNNGDITVTDLFKNNHTFTNGSNGSIILNGEVTNNWSSTFSNSGSLTFYADVTNKGTFNNSDTINLYSTFENYSSGNTLNNTGYIILNSDSTYFANVTGAGSVNGTGDAVVNLFLKGGKWHYISSPIDSASTNLFWGCALYSYNETTDKWVTHGANEILDPLSGYDVYCPGNRTITFQGALNVNSYTNNNITKSNGGYNLVGNPYMSTIDWDKSSGWTKVKLTNSVYVWNPDNQTIASYVSGSATNGGSRYIPPMQSFFVKNNGTGTGKLGTSKSIWVKITSVKFRNNDNTGNVIRFKAKSLVSGYADETVIRFNKSATDNFDNYFDANKMFSFNTQVPQLYTKANETETSINTLKEFDEQSIVPLYFKAAVSGKARISVSLENFPTCYNVYLEDKKENLVYDLMSSVYEFNADVNDDEDRFLVHFVMPQKINDTSSTNVVTTSVDENAPGMNVNIYSDKNEIVVNRNTSGATNCTIDVFTINGQMIAHKTTTDSQARIRISHAEGIYIVKVSDSNGSVSTKVNLSK